MWRAVRLTALLLVAALAPATAASASTAGGGAGNTSIDHTPCGQWLRGIDVSSAQARINWHDVAHAGVYFVMIKVSQGTTYVNTELRHQAQGAGSHGIPWGGYDYAYPELPRRVTRGAVLANAIADARYFVRHLPRGWNLPPVLDIEPNRAISPLPAGTVVLWAVTWLREVSGLTHTLPTVYTGAYYGWSGRSALQSYPLWVAAYPRGEGRSTPSAQACGISFPSTGGWRGFSVWQYSDNNRIWGFPYGLDTDAATPYWLETSHLGLVLSVAPKPGTNRYPAAVLTVGSAGAWVRHIQAYLKARGLYHGEVDAHFGELTRAAVMAWQHVLGIPADGEWGPVTADATSRYNAKHHLTI